MANRQQINLKLKGDKVDRWKDEIEENPEYASMTDLIRQSVEKEIAGRDVSTGRGGDTDREIAQLQDSINSMEEQISTLTHAINGIQQTIQSQPSDKHLRSEIFASLPAADSLQGPKSAEDIAEELGPVDETVVSQVLEDLADDVSTIERGYQGEDTIVYRKRE